MNGMGVINNANKSSVNDGHYLRINELRSGISIISLCVRLHRSLMEFAPTSKLTR